MNKSVNDERFTVSVPGKLDAWIEQERFRRAFSRSALLVHLVGEYRRDHEEQQRIARYAAAYARTPATPEEDALCIWT